MTTLTLTPQELKTLSERDLGAIIEGVEPGDVEQAREELKRRKRIRFASAGATRKR